MSAKLVVETLLVWAGVGAELLCCLGLLVMRDTFDRLHYLSAASTVGPVLLAAAVIVQESLSTAGLSALVIAVVMVIVGPVLTHVVGRTARVRTHERWIVLPQERVGERKEAG